MCIQWMHIIYCVVITWQSNPHISQFDSLYNESTSVLSMFVYKLQYHWAICFVLFSDVQKLVTDRMNSPTRGCTMMQIDKVSKQYISHFTVIYRYKQFGSWVPKLVKLFDLRRWLLYSNCFSMVCALSKLLMQSFNRTGHFNQVVIGTWFIEKQVKQVLFIKFMCCLVWYKPVAW